MVADLCVRGVTTNPTIFDKAISGGRRRLRRPAAVARRVGADVDAIIRALTTDDVRAACDVFTGLWQRERRRGRPRLDRGRPAAGARHRRHHRAGDGALGDRRPAQRPDQDPGHPRRPARHHARSSASGHQRQRHPDLLGRPLPRRRRRVRGRARVARPSAATTCRGIQSVASFFVSRIDTEVDARLAAIGTRGRHATARRGRHRHRPAGLAGARGVARHRPLGGPRGARAPTRSARCGPRPA